jgi:hypothetical protein
MPSDKEIKAAAMALAYDDNPERGMYPVEETPLSYYMPAAKAALSAAETVRKAGG